MRPEMREIIKKIPKLRGHGVNRAEAVNAERVRAIPINVSLLETLFDTGSEVTPKTLVAKGAISSNRKIAPKVKILGTGELTKKLKVSGCQVSGSAKVKIEKAGGTIV
jgi:large subunit ribosomal protein L15